MNFDFVFTVCADFPRDVFFFFFHDRDFFVFCRADFPPGVIFPGKELPGFPTFSRPADTNGIG